MLEYIHGYHLGLWHKYVRAERGRLDPEVAIHLVIRVLDALHYAHILRRPDGTPFTVVHRDVSPSNVLLDATGVVKLVDFGIARMANMGTDYRTTSTRLKGKFAYMAPELFAGESPSPSTDTYSCAVLLHEFLLGRNELRGASPHETVQRVISRDLSPVRDENPDVAPELDEILRTASHRDPSQRYPDALSFARALRQVRRISDEDATRILAAQLEEDFHGPMAEKLDLVPLHVLDEAWRELKPESRPPRAGSDHPTMVESTPPVSTTARLRSRDDGRKRTWLVAAVVAGAAAIGGALALSQGGSERTDGEGGEDRGFILVDREADPGPAPEEQLAVADPADAASAPPADEPEIAADVAGPSARAPSKARSSGGTGEPAAREGSAARAAALTRAFARRGADVESCFRRHAKLRGRIAARGGHLSRRGVGCRGVGSRAPAELARTALGACLLEVARSTTFPPQDAPTAFRIPLEVEAR